MERFGAITSVSFDQTALPLPVSVRISRRAEPAPAGSDSDAFATSVQLRRPVIAVEVRTRQTDLAESFSLGQAGELSLEIAPTRAGQRGRVVSIDRVVLTDIELQYDQAAPALARLSFLAEAVDGAVDPFSSQESNP